MTVLVRDGRRKGKIFYCIRNKRHTLLFFTGPSMWLLEHPGSGAAGTGPASGSSCDRGRSGAWEVGRRQSEQVSGHSRRDSRGVGKSNLVGPGFGKKNGRHREEI